MDQRDRDHKLDKKVITKRHDSEMALKDKECNSDKLSMLKEHKEKTKEINAMMKEPEVKAKGLCLLYSKCNLRLLIQNNLPLLFSSRYQRSQI